MLNTVLVSSAFCMYGSELLGGLQPPEFPPPPPPPPPQIHHCTQARNSKQNYIIILSCFSIIFLSYFNVIVSSFDVIIFSLLAFLIGPREVMKNFHHCPRHAWHRCHSLKYPPCNLSPQMVQTIPGDNLYWGKSSYVGIKYPSC